MNPELLQRLAEEAGFARIGVDVWDDSWGGTGDATLARFAALVAEECARVVERSPSAEAAAHRLRAAFPTPSEPAATVGRMHAENLTAGELTDEAVRRAFPIPKD